VSRYLSIDSEQGQLYVASLNTKGGQVVVEQAIVLADFGSLADASAGKRLKDALAEAGIAPAPVLMAVGRERVILKDVKYPAGVSPADEPALVRFQMSKELADGGDAVVIDYFSLPTLDPDGQRRALAFAIRKDVLGPIKTLCAAAGLKLASITPRPFGVAAALMRAIKDGAVTPPESQVAPLAILVRGDKWGELVILRGGQVAFARSLTGMALNSEQAMLGEIRRNLAVFAGTSTTNAVQALYVAEGDVPGGWSGRLRAALTIPVQSFDAIAGVATTLPPEVHGSFTGPVGLAALRARSLELPINFLSPREPKPVSDPGKRLLALIGVAAALLLVGGLAIGLFIVNQRSSTLTALRNQKSGLDDDIKKLDDSVKRVKAVKDWEAKGISWLDELYDLTARFPDLTKAEVVQLIAKPIEQAKNSKNKHTAEMELTMYAGSGKVVDDLSVDMSHDSRYYLVFPKQSKGSAGTFASSRKSEQYLFRAQIEPREPNKYTLKLQTPPPAESKGKRTAAEQPRENGMAGGVGTFGGAQ